MINIQATMKELFGNSCLAYCYAYLAFKQHHGELIPTIKYLTRKVLEGWYAEYIEDDGYVSKPVQYFNIICEGNRIYDIQKFDLFKLSDLPEGLWIVEFKLKRTDKESHFAIAERKGIVFDPSGRSNTCAYGVPVSYRKLLPCSSDDWVVRHKEPL